MTERHLRRCWDCGSIAEHASDVAPEVCCQSCGSQDTRRLSGRACRVRSLTYAEVAGLFEQWEERESEVKADREQFLRDSGWDKHCNTPGSLWVWKKGEWNGCDTSTALYIEQSLRIFGEEVSDG